MKEKKIKAVLVTIGDELLIGQVIDTNSAFISQQLNTIGVNVQKRVSIGDDAKEIRKSLDMYSGKFDFIILTGGLGVTSDDLTKNALCKYFHSRMVISQAALEHVKSLYKNIYKKPISPVNLAQAKVPAACEVLINRRGSAPCMIFEKEHTYIISMAGVPYEMEGIVEDLLPWIQSRKQLPKIVHRTLITTGISESDLETKIAGFEKQLPPYIKLAYLPGLGKLRLRLTTTAFNHTEESELKKQFSRLKKEVKPYLLSNDDIAPEIKLGKILRRKNMTVSTAESCTGGSIAGRITSVSGSSDYFPGSVVSYSNEVKIKELGVKKDTLKKHGAVSEETVREMISGILKKMKTDIGIAVSGIMGPNGGSDEKPVGTVWIAVGNKQETIARKFKFRYDRRRNTEATVSMALYMAVGFAEGRK
ncbi:MAG: CinA family nicotinamide mononucleotide deamidase-related protein [Chitinophagaceae bacterium]|nr:CinA family nicotinamide mononucleotide deamidase-related protein [Chitinophagaceae bacterium]